MRPLGLPIGFALLLFFASVALVRLFYRRMSASSTLGFQKVAEARSSSR